MSLEYDRYLTHQLRSLSDEARLERNARFALLHHGKYFPVSPGAAVLEIGPGYGAMLRLLRNERGLQNLHAVDVSAEVVRVCNQTMPESTELTPDTTVFLNSHHATYDLILMFHVLEHVPKDNALPLLMAARGALRPGGKLVLEVPNIAHPLTGPYHRYHDFTHTLGFTDQSLGFILRTAGFANVSVYPCRVPRVSFARVWQRAGQDAVELIAGLLLRLYMPREPVMLSSVLGACATD